MHFSATVIKGEGRGKELGFPTANLDKTDLTLDYGVYLVKVGINGKKFDGLMHFGPKKTFNDNISAEVFVKDFSGDLYGVILEVEVIKKIREVIKFNSPEDLKRQLVKDAEYFKK